MKLLKPFFIFCFTFSFSSFSHSNGIPVIDAASIKQQIVQITHLVTQIKTLQNQLITSNAQFQSMQAPRGFGDLIDTRYDQNLNVVIDDVLASAGIKSGDYYELKGALLDLYNEANTNASVFQSRARLTRQQSLDRFQELLGLITEVDEVQDQKDVLDLQARIGGEQVMLQNELVKAFSIQAENDANQQIYNQKQLELLMSLKGERIIP